MSTTAVKKSESQKTSKVGVIKSKVNEGINVSIELSKIGAAYTAAINGKMKFSEVKEMLKKLHKQVKKSSKK